MRKRLYRAVGAVAVLAGVLAVGFLAQTSPLLQGLAAQGGYTGVFVLAFLNGFNVVVPFATTSFMPAWIAAGLSFPILIALITLGMTIADTVAFFAGRWGRAAFSRSQEKFFARLSVWRALFLSSACGDVFLGLIRAAAQ